MGIKSFRRPQHIKTKIKKTKDLNPPKFFKMVSFSSYFHLSYSFFSRILCYTNSLTFQDLSFSKNYVTDIVPGKFDDNRLRSTSSLFFS